MVELTCHAEDHHLSEFLASNCIFALWEKHFFLHIANHGASNLVPTQYLQYLPALSHRQQASLRNVRLPLASTWTQSQVLAHIWTTAHMQGIFSTQRQSVTPSYFLMLFSPRILQAGRKLQKLSSCFVLGEIICLFFFLNLYLLIQKACSFSDIRYGALNHTRHHSAVSSCYLWVILYSHHMRRTADTVLHVCITDCRGPFMWMPKIGTQ